VVTESTPQGGAALLERPVTDGPDTGGPIVLRLVDTTLTARSPAPGTFNGPLSLAVARTTEVLDARVEFRVTLPGLTCAIVLDDDNGPPLYTIPPARRRRVRTGDLVVVHLPGHP